MVRRNTARNTMYYVAVFLRWLGDLLDPKTFGVLALALLCAACTATIRENATTVRLGWPGTRGGGAAMNLTAGHVTLLSLAAFAGIVVLTVVAFKRRKR